MSIVFTRLEKNIVDVIQEEQIKLGYCRETIRLFYPLQSLNRLLGTTLMAEEMQRALTEQFNKTDCYLSETEISHKADRFCFMIPDNIVEKVYKEKGESSFITEFIRTVEKHGCTIEEIHHIFLKYSKKVHFERSKQGEFDYIIYFEEEGPDDFRYCITDEGCHMIYHRFTPEDYEEFQFE